MTKFFYILFLSVMFLTSISLSYSVEENTTTFSNSKMGIEFKYPLSWKLSNSAEDQKCDLCVVSLEPDSRTSISITSYNLNNPFPLFSECKCNSLKDFVKWEYQNDPLNSVFNKFTEVINDRPILINDNISGWEMESTYVKEGEFSRQLYDFWVLVNETGYKISFGTDLGPSYEKYLSEVKNMIETIKFVPIEIPKKNIPSFLQ